jgi:pimeloyl-ACP methyl ester carboxylesterase
MDELVALPNGGAVGVLTHGDPDGYPLMFCHGTPGSRYWHDFTDEAGKQHGLQVVVAERPGYGLTPFDPAFTISRWPDVVGALADALGFERFAVVGYSGGSPYAIACAAQLPERVSALGLMAGVGPPDSPGADKGVNKSEAVMMDLAVRHPARARLAARALAFVTTKMPQLAFRTALREAGPADREMLLDEGPYAMVPFMKAAFAQGPDGTVLDYRLLAQPWGIDLGAVRCATDVWQGDSDTFVPMHHAEDLAARIPGARLHRLPGVGHASIQRHIGSIFEGVAAEASRPS